MSSTRPPRQATAPSAAPPSPTSGDRLAEPAAGLLLLATAATLLTPPADHLPQPVSVLGGVAAATALLVLAVLVTLVRQIRELARRIRADDDGGARP